MSSISDPRFKGIDFENSYLTGVIVPVDGGMVRSLP